MHRAARDAEIPDVIIVQRWMNLEQSDCTDSGKKYLVTH